jgi:hypothetical protein
MTASSPAPRQMGVECSANARCGSRRSTMKPHLVSGAPSGMKSPRLNLCNPGMIRFALGHGLRYQNCTGWPPVDDSTGWFGPLLGGGGTCCGAPPACGSALASSFTLTPSGPAITYATVAIKTRPSKPTTSSTNRHLPCHHAVAQRHDQTGAYVLRFRSSGRYPDVPRW